LPPHSTHLEPLQKLAEDVDILMDLIFHVPIPGLYNVDLFPPDDEDEEDEEDEEEEHEGEDEEMGDNSDTNSTSTIRRMIPTQHQHQVPEEEELEDKDEELEDEVEEL